MTGTEVGCAYGTCFIIRSLFTPITTASDAVLTTHSVHYLDDLGGVRRDTTDGPWPFNPILKNL